MSRLDLSPCGNLRVIGIHPKLVGFPETHALLCTVSSKHFEKLVIHPHAAWTPENLRVNDRNFRLFAERLYQLGARKPLTMVLELLPDAHRRHGTLDVQKMFPQFCEVGVVVKEECVITDSWTD